MPKNKVLLHILILLIAVFISFYWISNEYLNRFSLQLSGVLMLTLIFTRRLLKPAAFKLAESTISAIAVLLITSSSGGVTSPLFFLNYFLLFELSLLLEPLVPLFLAGFLICFYLLTSTSRIPAMTYGMLIAFPFMTPLAYIFGKLYQKEENQKKEISGLEKKVEKLEEELVEEELNTSIL